MNALRRLNHTLLHSGYKYTTYLYPRLQVKLLKLLGTRLENLWNGMLMKCAASYAFVPEWTSQRLFTEGQWFTETIGNPQGFSSNMDTYRTFVIIVGLLGILLVINLIIVTKMKEKENNSVIMGLGSEPPS